MFIAQPGHGFNTHICQELLAKQLGHRKWNMAEFAVAWANYSGVNKIFDQMRDFLSSGGHIRVTVGLDFGSTTYEGLGRLLELEQGADMTSHVFFDENPACTFHPKVFLFSNDDEARLLVGSNNMTGAGFETNIEASLCFSGDLRDDTIRGARHALAAWRDEESDSRTRRLTRDFLEQLRERRYVLTEEEMRIRRNSGDGHRASTESPLFGRSSTRPHRPGRLTAGERTKVGRTTGSAFGEVLLMRVRPRRDGSQVQISMRILEVSFMHGVEKVVSIDGAIREIGYNIARGVRNTARFEAPEMRGMKNPVARFQWVNDEYGKHRPDRVLQYEIFDAHNHPEGRAILRKLEEGMTSPPVTKLGELSQEETVISTGNQANAQWYRLDSV
jgi:HKD family nuclease